jgi:hypothetical protein
VRRAVDEHGGAFPAGLWVLAAEVSWDGDGPVVHRVAHGPVGAAALVVRIAVPPEGTDLGRAVGGLIGELAARGPREVQLDVDWPTRRLGEAAAAVRALRAAAAPVPLTVTTLASWLDEPRALRAVVQAADGYVLQLHALDPRRRDGSVLVPDASDRVEQAAALGVPFRAALPTYRYRVARRPDGTVAAIAAEQGRLLAPPGGEVVTFGADPREVGDLVAALQRDRPALLEALIWFRLPVASDQEAWAWPTLAAVREGRVPSGEARIDVAAEPGGAWTLTVRNVGDDELALPALRVASPVAVADAVGGYRWAAGERRFAAPSERLRPGATRVVGWVRGPGQPEVHLVEEGP